MRWKNIKTVMIVILLAVNVWLIYLLAGRYRAQTYLDSDLLRNTVEILARDEIYLTVDQLDARRRGADVYAAELCDDYFEQVAAIFTSSPVTEVFPTPTGMRFITEREETVSVSVGFDLTYVCAGASREAFSGLCTTIAGEGEPVAVGGFSLRSLRDTLDTLLSSTVSGGGSVAPAHAKLCFDAAWQQDGYTLMQCSQEMDEKKINGHTVVCLFDEEGKLLYLNGTWSFLSLAHNYSAQLYDQINILFMEKAALADLRASGEVEGAMTLESLSLCYILNTASDDDGRSMVYYSPAWRIRYVDGTEHLYSAVTGEPPAEE